jgi:hypothetical protein
MTELIKVQLLNDGRYFGLEDISFPVQVMAIAKGNYYIVPCTELEVIGADMSVLDDPEDPYWPFEDGTEAVRVEED